MNLVLEPKVVIKIKTIIMVCKKMVPISNYYFFNISKIPSPSLNSVNLAL